jgi:hypothetical protein
MPSQPSVKMSNLPSKASSVATWVASYQAPMTEFLGLVPASVLGGIENDSRRVEQLDGRTRCVECARHWLVDATPEWMYVVLALRERQIHHCDKQARP